MVGELAALAAALVWAVGNVMLKPLSAKFHPILLNYIRCIGAALLFLVILGVTGRFVFLSQVSLQSAVVAIIGTFIGIGIGDSLFVLSLRYVDLSLAYPISTCGYPLIVTAIAYFALHEVITVGAMVGILLVLAGLYFVAFSRGPLLIRFSLTSPQERRGLLLLFFTMIAWAVAIIMIKQGTEGLDMPVANFVRFLGAAVLLTPLGLAHRARLAENNNWRNISLAGLNGAVTFGVGAAFFLVALRQSGAAMTSVLSSTSPLFLVPLATLFFKEKVTPRLLFGIVLSVLGLCFVLLS